jgi:hypothetical protein
MVKFPVAEKRLSRALADSAIRRVRGRLLKALKMIDLKLMRRIDIIRAQSVTEWSLDDAIRARKNFRDPGVAHPPRRLTKSEDSRLLDLVRIEARTGPSPGAKKVTKLVCVLEPYFNFLSVLSKGKRNPF